MGDKVVPDVPVEFDDKKIEPDTLKETLPYAEQVKGLEDRIGAIEERLEGIEGSHAASPKQVGNPKGSNVTLTPGLHQPPQHGQHQKHLRFFLDTMLPIVITVTTTGIVGYYLFKTGDQDKDIRAALKTGELSYQGIIDSSDVRCEPFVFNGRAVSTSLWVKNDSLAVMFGDYHNEMHVEGLIVDGDFFMRNREMEPIFKNADNAYRGWLYKIKNQKLLDAENNIANTKQDIDDKKEKLYRIFK